MIAVDLPGLTTWLHSRRWFSGKGRAMTGSHVVDVMPVSAEGPWLTTVEVTYADGVVGDRTADRWLLVLTPVPAGDPSAIGSADGRAVAELGDRPEAAIALLGAIARGATLHGAAGTVARASSVGEAPSPAPTVRPMGVEQSNTSVVVGGEVAVKVVRHLEAGPNPDVEVGMALTAAGFTGSPALVGAIVGPDEAAMVVAGRFVPDARDGWALAVEEAAGGDHGIVSGLKDLGALTAEMHAKLRDALPTVQSDAVDGDRWRTAMADELAVTRRVVETLSPQAAATMRARVRAAVAKAPPGLGLLQRIHGDYHLGQVLRDREGRWWILDFEGEPGRPVAERRQPANPARDVAGMLRSLDYARAQAARGGGDAGAAEEWVAAARAAFLEGYGEEGREWLQAFEVEKLLYEVRYEAANRPDWLPIPLAALGIALPQAPTRARHNETTDEPMTDPTTPPKPADKPDKAGKAQTAGQSMAAKLPAADKRKADKPSEPTAEPAAAAPRATGPTPAVVSTAAALAAGTVHDPHQLLGFHPDGDGWVVRAWRPGAESVAYLATPEADPLPCDQPVNGLF
ncbi:MAG TPA: phosphotransferase, partial [Euzebya sp.]|nr:phosphotransferase [Euzebya sp.]